MKPFFFFLALLPVALAIPAPQDSNTDCTCPPPTCPKDEPAGCECRNKAILDCSDQKQAAGLKCPVPALAACPKCPDTNGQPPPPTPKEKPPPAVKPNPNFKCPCEQVYCIQSYPESCECENRNKRACFDNCGGLEPTYDNRCGFGDDTAARKTNPGPNTQPEPNANVRRGPPYVESPGPVVPLGGLPPAKKDGNDNKDDQSKACREQEKKEEKGQKKREKAERKKKKNEEKGCPGGCKESEECGDIIFEKVGGGSETKKGCLPKKQ